MEKLDGLKLKVCGITSMEQLQDLDKLGVDYAGMIFYDQSKRYMLDKIMGEEVREKNLSIALVGVFVNSTEEEVMIQVEQYNLSLVQLHGDETPGFCQRISDRVKLIKAFRISDKNKENIDWMIKPYEEFCDYYLFDTASGEYGGSGQKFNWKLLEQNKINKPFFLSGGIGAGDVDQLKAFSHPYLFGVDINSRFEKSPGIKDIQLVGGFLDSIQLDKKADPAPFVVN